MSEEQLPLDGIAPAAMRRHRMPKPDHLPTVEDAERLRDWIDLETCLPGNVPRNMNFEQLKKMRRKLTITYEERTELLRLADKWESDALARETP